MFERCFHATRNLLHELVSSVVIEPDAAVSGPDQVQGFIQQCWQHLINRLGHSQGCGNPVYDFQFSQAALCFVVQTCVFDGYRCLPGQTREELQLSWQEFCSSPGAPDCKQTCVFILEQDGNPHEMLERVLLCGFYD